MRILGIIVLMAAALGWWVHQQRAGKPQSAATRPAVVAGFQPYTPAHGAHSGPQKAHVAGMRLITPAPEFQQQVATSALDAFIRQVEVQSADVLRLAKPGNVRILFTSGLKYQTVQVQSQDGNIEGALLQALHSRLMSLERLRVKSSDVAFELQLTVAR